MLTAIETPTVTNPESDDYPTADELRNLAERARERGVVIERTATSARAYDPDRGRFFDLTAYTCSCRLFAAAGACQHFAALVA